MYVCTNKDCLNKDCTRGSLMGFNFHISLQETDKKLHDWIKQMQQNNELSPSLIFRDAMFEKKREWDINHTENPAILHKRIDDMRKTLEHVSQKVNDFVDAKNLTDEWFDFFNDVEEKKKQKG